MTSVVIIFTVSCRVVAQFSVTTKSGITRGLARVAQLCWYGWSVIVKIGIMGKAGIDQ